MDSKSNSESVYTGRMKLVRPSAEYENSFKAAMAEEFPNATGVNADGFDFSLMRNDFKAFAESLCQRSLGHRLPPGYVEDSLFWLVEGTEYIGRASIRHRLNDHLLLMGGHIGYVIRQSKRRHGYGTEILRLALVEARALGLRRVLITCDITNVASRRIIEKNGGVLEDVRANPAGGPDKNRYWIELP